MLFYGYLVETEDYEALGAITNNDPPMNTEAGAYLDHRVSQEEDTIQSIKIVCSSSEVHCCARSGLAVILLFQLQAIEGRASQVARGGGAGGTDVPALAGSPWSVP